MRWGDLGIHIGGTLFVYLYPLILLALFAAPFIVVYLRKKRITLISVLISALIGALLVSLILLITILGLAYLQGYAARSIYEPI
jgi:hypothetical protein